MRTSDMFPSKYVSSADIDSPVVVTMDKISIEEVGEGKDELPVLSFTDYDKGLVLNKTNTKKIASIHGTETLDWADKQIVLIKSVTSYKGEEIDCIRIKEHDAIPA
jgi:hypothetical protein|tara:strand:+ start:179 stop:496 length:318 start_codon:yes stop_codon:yes gene_type:complete